MRHSINELVERIYTLYPQGILSNHPWYEASEEYRRLDAARRRAGEEGGATWSALLKSLAARLPECVVQNRSFHLPAGGVDAAYSAWLDLPESMYKPEEMDRRLGFLVSFVVPYYVIYSTRLVRLRPLEEGTSARRETPLAPLLDEQPRASVHVETIEDSSAGKGFVSPEVRGLHCAVYVGSPDYRPPEPSSRREVCFELAPDEQRFAQAIVEEIEATFPGHEPMPPNIGQLIVPDVDAKRDLMRTSTIYDCFFTDNW